MRIYIELPVKTNDKPRLIIAPQFETDEEEKYKPLYCYLDGHKGIADLDGDVYNFETILDNSKGEVNDTYRTEIEEVFDYLDDDMIENLVKIASALWEPSVITLDSQLDIDWVDLYNKVKKLLN